MPPAPPPTPPYLPLAAGIAMVPVDRNVQAFADEVRRAVSQLQPDCLVLELPRVLTAELPRLLELLPEIHVLAWRTDIGRSWMIAGDPCDPLIEAARLGQEHGIPCRLIDFPDGEGGEKPPVLPDDLAIEQLGLAAYATMCISRIAGHDITERERVLAARLRAIGGEFKRPLFIGGIRRFANLRLLLSQEPGFPIDPPDMPITASIMRLRGSELTKFLREIPYTAYLYELFRSSHGPEERFPIMRALHQLLVRAARQYEAEYDERVSLTEWRALYQFGRNLSVVRGLLRPRLYELLIAAKGCVDDDFGAIALEVATTYPPNSEAEIPFEDDEEPEPWKPSAEDEEEPQEAEEPPMDRRHGSFSSYADFGDGAERLEHAYGFPDLQELGITFRRRRPTEAEKDLWREQFQRGFWGGICSWPPEDALIENFFRTVRHRAFQQASESHSTVEEFGTSILDGIDLRETMRHWHEKKIYVRRERVPPGKVGPVVLLWRDMPLRTAGLWQTVLYAENQNESDIAFYSTPMGQEMVGPGITRIEYFGILSVFPAAQIPDVWRVRELSRWRTCGRMLIAAAIMLSEERYVAVVASHPPDNELRTFARESGRALLYLPLGTFGKPLLRRVRQCHILGGRNVRGYAGDYIPKL